MPGQDWNVDNEQDEIQDDTPTYANGETQSSEVCGWHKMATSKGCADTLVLGAVNLEMLKMLNKLISYLRSNCEKNGGTVRESGSTELLKVKVSSISAQS